ncbi:hypothetical protein HPB50_021318 [Hyalomma asiaticum]|uniref:Uncharacterized protein n=1 Tax=Hyalomma asiaticum TaxID=266040 RepID=A0ACB7S739_HYAAI|nr:hypothetical protein HPB50_021318 [Hyalomma asiaticum]
MFTAALNIQLQCITKLVDALITKCAPPTLRRLPLVCAWGKRRRRDAGKRGRKGTASNAKRREKGKPVVGRAAAALSALSSWVREKPRLPLLPAGKAAATARLGGGGRWACMALGGTWTDFQRLIAEPLQVRLSPRLDSQGDEWRFDAKNSTTNWVETPACRKGFSSTVEPLHSLCSSNATSGYHHRSPVNQAQQPGEVGGSPRWLSEPNTGLLPHPDSHHYSPAGANNNSSSGNRYYSPWNQPSPCQRPGSHMTTTNGITQFGRQMLGGDGPSPMGRPPSEGVVALDDMVARLVDDDHGMPYQHASRGLLTTRHGSGGGSGGGGGGHYGASTGHGFSLAGLGNGNLPCSREGSNDGQHPDFSSLALTFSSEPFTEDALSYLSSLGTGGGNQSSSSISDTSQHQQASLLNTEDCQPLQSNDSLGPAWATMAAGGGAKLPLPPLSHQTMHHSEFEPPCGSYGRTQPLQQHNVPPELSPRGFGGGASSYGSSLTAAATHEFRQRQQLLQHLLTTTGGYPTLQQHMAAMAAAAREQQHFAYSPPATTSSR